MPRDVAGNYTLAQPGNPVIPHTTGSSAVQNATLSDIAAALTASVCVDGRTPMSGALNMAGFAILAAGLITAAGINVTGAGIPANGLYLPAANTVAIASNATQRWSVNATGNHVFAAPSAGVHTINGAVQLGTGVGVPAATGAGVFFDYAASVARMYIGDGTGYSWRIARRVGGVTTDLLTVADAGTPLTVSTANDTPFLAGSAGGANANFYIGTVNGLQIGTSTNHALSLYTNNATRIAVSAAGNVVIGQPSAGDTVTISASLTGSYAIHISALAANATTVGLDAPAAQPSSIYLNGNGKALGAGGVLQYNGADNMRIKHLNAVAGALILGAGGLDSVTFDRSGGVTVTAPTAAITTLTIGVNGANPIGCIISGNATGAIQSNISNNNGGANSSCAFELTDGVSTGYMQYQGQNYVATLAGGVNGSALVLHCVNANPIQLATNGIVRLSVGGAGNLLVAAPAAGNHVINCVAGGQLRINGGDNVPLILDNPTSGSGFTAQSWYYAGALKAFASWGNVANQFRVGCALVGAGIAIVRDGNIDAITITGAGNTTINDTIALAAGGLLTTGISFSATANFGVFVGSGVPTLAAAKGSIYLRSDGSAVNNRAYIATDGAGTWTALTTAA